MIYAYKSFLEPYISSYLELQKTTVCDFTYAHMCGVLQHFDRFVLSHGCKDCNFSEEQVFSWMSTLAGKSSTIGTYVSCVKSFFRFLGGYGFRPFLPSYHGGSDDYMAYEFSDEEIASILSIADNYAFYPHANSQDWRRSPKRYVYLKSEFPMLLRLLLGCGLRLEEASTLTLRDIDFGNNTITIRKSKSREYRIAPMDPSLASILSDYFLAMGIGADHDTYIFPGTDFTRPIPSYCFRNRFNLVLERAGISLQGRKKHERGPCIHCLRHAFAHRSFKQGVHEGWAINDQIPWLSVYLGHKSLRETEKYLKFNSEMFTDEIKPFESYSADLYPGVNFDE